MVSYRFQHLESPGSNPSWALFSRQGWIHFMIIFETWIADSFAYFFVVVFIHFRQNSCIMQTELLRTV